MPPRVLQAPLERHVELAAIRAAPMELGPAYAGASYYTHVAPSGAGAARPFHPFDHLTRLTLPPSAPAKSAKLIKRRSGLPGITWSIKWNPMRTVTLQDYKQRMLRVLV